MADENRSTLDESPRRLSAPAPGQGAVLHLAFTQDKLVSSELRAVGEGEIILGRGEPLFARTALDDRRISRGHARLGRRGDSWELEDLGSHNGTYLKGRPLKGRAALSWGDVIRVGDTLLVFTQAIPSLSGEEVPLESNLVGQGPAITQVRAGDSQDPAGRLDVGDRG